MKRAFLTGGTGFIGGHVAWSLVQHGYEVVALVRPGSRLQFRHDSIVERTGDVRDLDSVRAAMDGCDAVIHAAAHYALWSRDPGLIYDVNVQGTRNVLQTAIDLGVPRIVHTSTVGTVRFRADGMANEGDWTIPRLIESHYKRSKYEAERIALRMAQAGAPIVVVNPTAPIGSRDVKPTPTGKVVVDFLRGNLPAFVDTGLNLVPVADVAEGHVLALEKGQPGRRYLLGHADGNLTLLDVLRRLSAITGIAAPRWRIPLAVARAIAEIDNLIEGVWLRREPRIPIEGVRMARHRMWVDPSRAVRELGMPQHSIDEALAQAAEWFVERGYAPAPHGPAGATRGRKPGGRRTTERVR
jgi:dihydroflavonol-4-reductase